MTCWYVFHLRSVENSRRIAISKLFPDLSAFEGGLSRAAENWLRGLDSNQDSQIQSLESYQLDDPGVVTLSQEV
jgi:hypothetical protein